MSFDICHLQKTSYTFGIHIRKTHLCYFSDMLEHTDTSSGPMEGDDAAAASLFTATTSNLSIVIAAIAADKEMNPQQEKMPHYRKKKGSYKR